MVVPLDQIGWGVFHKTCGPREGAPYRHQVCELVEGRLLRCPQCWRYVPPPIEMIALAEGVLDAYQASEERRERIRVNLGLSTTPAKKRKESYLQQFWRAVGIGPF